jgi:hypothetical protein
MALWASGCVAFALMVDALLVVVCVKRINVFRGGSCQGSMKRSLEVFPRGHKGSSSRQRKLCERSMSASHTVRMVLTGRCASPNGSGIESKLVEIGRTHHTGEAKEKEDTQLQAKCK